MPHLGVSLFGSQCVVLMTKHTVSKTCNVHSIYVLISVMSDINVKKVTLVNTAISMVPGQFHFSDGDLSGTPQFVTNSAHCLYMAMFLHKKNVKDTYLDVHPLSFCKRRWGICSVSLFITDILMAQ